MRFCRAFLPRFEGLERSFLSSLIVPADLGVKLPLGFTAFLRGVGNAVLRLGNLLCKFYTFGRYALLFCQLLVFSMLLLMLIGTILLVVLDFICWKTSCI